MFSLIQTGSRGFKRGEIPYEAYEWGDQPLWLLLTSAGRGEAGVRRVDTKRFIRFEYLWVRKRKDGYRYERTSHWFIKFPVCKTDKEILIANVAVWIIGFPLLLKMTSALVLFVANI